MSDLLCTLVCEYDQCNVILLPKLDLQLQVLNVLYETSVYVLLILLFHKCCINSQIL